MDVDRAQLTAYKDIKAIFRNDAQGECELYGSLIAQVGFRHLREEEQTESIFSRFMVVKKTFVCLNMPISR